MTTTAEIKKEAKKELFYVLYETALALAENAENEIEAATLKAEAEKLFKTHAKYAQ